MVVVGYACSCSQWKEQVAAVCCVYGGGSAAVCAKDGLQHTHSCTCPPVALACSNLPSVCLLMCLVLQPPSG